MSSASAVLPAYRRQTPYILGENRRYNASCIRLSPSRHPCIKSLSEIIWLRSVFNFLDFTLSSKRIYQTDR